MGGVLSMTTGIERVAAFPTPSTIRALMVVGPSASSSRRVSSKASKSAPAAVPGSVVTPVTPLVPAATWVGWPPMVTVTPEASATVTLTGTVLVPKSWPAAGAPMVKAGGMVSSRTSRVTADTLPTPSRAVTRMVFGPSASVNVCVNEALPSACGVRFATVAPSRETLAEATPLVASVASSLRGKARAR